MPLSPSLLQSSRRRRRFNDITTATRWEALVPTVNRRRTCDIDGARCSPAKPSDCGALEQIPVLTQELVNEQNLVVNGNALALAQTKQVTDLTAQVSGLQSKAVDDAKTCQDQIKVVKDAARKSKKHWYEFGFVSGFLARQFLIGV